MPVHPEYRIAAVIRKHPNGTDASILGAAIAPELDGGQQRPELAEVLADIIRKVNPDHTMGAGRLAEVIWDVLLLDAPPAVRAMAHELEGIYESSN